MAHDFGIEDHIVSIVCDNATSNDAMVNRLAHLLPEFEGHEDCTRCFAHVINLVTKSLLKMFDAPGQTDDVEVEAAEEEGEVAVNIDNLLRDLADIEKETPERDDPTDLYDEVAMMAEAERERFYEQTKDVSSALSKVGITV